MNETQLQMKTLLCHDAYSEGFVRVGYKRRLGVGMSNLLSLSLSCRDSPMVLAHTAMPLSCSMRHAPCLPTDLLSVTMKLGDYLGRGKSQGLIFRSYPSSHRGKLLLRSFTTRECQSLSIRPREEWQRTFGMNLGRVLFSS